MHILDLKGNELALRALKEFGINGGIVIAAVLIVFGAGRTTGLIDVVGYQWKSKLSNGLVNNKAEPISLVTPVWLSAGDRLTARYDADVHAGQVKFYIREGLIPAPFMRETADRHYVTQSGEGEYTFTAPNDGVYWPKSRITSNYAGSSAECKAHRKSKGVFKTLLVPDTKCPSKVANYSVWWFKS